MVSAWFGGLGPGLVTTVLTAAAADFYWMDPVDSLKVNEWGDFIALLLFAGIGVMISGLNEAWRSGAAKVTRSEERLRVTLASIGDAVITTDAEGRVRRLNRVAQELTGWKQAEAEGRPLQEIFRIVNEESRLPAENPLDRVLREEGTTVVGTANHTLLLSRDVREFPIEDSAAPIRTAEGTVIGAVIVFRDATERRRAEREHGKLLERERSARARVETSESQLRLALEAGRMGTWQWTVGTGEVKWSEGLEAIHGLAPGGFPGTFEAFQREIHPDDRDRVLADIREASEGARPHHIEYRILRSDGAIRWVEGRGQLFRDAEGRPERMVGVCSDITERKRVETERAELLEREQTAREEIEKASLLKDEFLMALSHELRTPLSAILGWARVLSSGGLTAERTSDAIESIQRNALAEARLVDSLLDMTRIRSGKLKLDLERIDLASPVEAAVDMFRPDAEEKNLQLETVLPSSPVPFIGDPTRLQQIVWNLVSNAVKFTPRRGRIEVRLDSSDSEARIRVTDTGEGIPSELLPRVFERFTQADTVDTREYGGLGLGLAIVRELVQAHGGTVVAESAGPGQGAVFTVRLPLSGGTNEMRVSGGAAGLRPSGP